MKRRLVTDELWKRAEPLIPKPPPDPRGGRPRADDRLCLAGIIFVLKTGIQWGELPGELGVSGSTCWRLLRDWKEAGVWGRLLEELPAELNAHGWRDLSLVVVNSTSVRELKRGQHTGPNPTAANVNDGTRLVDAIPSIRGVEPLLPERGQLDGRGLGQVRWVVERTLS